MNKLMTNTWTLNYKLDNMEIGMNDCSEQAKYREGGINIYYIIVDINNTNC